ncbi:hypothetical protein HDU80_006851 [Chytriomyces hyalinus]|nr:hypothetical protein HDU80_006851 [Chytriomyces hyalinus]
MLPTETMGLLLPALASFLLVATVLHSPLASLTTVCAGMLLYFAMFHRRILLAMATPGTPTVNLLNLLYFNHEGFFVKLDMDLPFNNLFPMPICGVTHTVHRPSGRIELPNISISFVDKKGNSTRIVDLMLSNALVFKTGENTLRIKQEALQVIICDKEICGNIAQTVIEKNLAGYWDPNHDIVVSISLHGTLRILGFHVYRGFNSPPVQVSLKWVHDYLFPSASFQPTQRRTSTPPQQPAPQLPDGSNILTRRKSGLSGFLPGIQITREPSISTEGVQLALYASINFTSPPTLDLSIHRVQIGIYINNIMVTSATISPFRIHAYESTQVPIRIAFNNPRVLRNAHLAHVVVDLMNLLARGVGIGVVAIETVANQTARYVTGRRESFATNASAKILSVEGYGVTGEVLDVGWLSHVLGKIDLKVELFGPGAEREEHELSHLESGFADENSGYSDDTSLSVDSWDETVFISRRRAHSPSFLIDYLQ